MEAFPQINFGRGTMDMSPTPQILAGSPYVYTNDTGGPVTLLISGGTVTTIEVSRDGANWMLAGLLAGQFMLAPGDLLRAAYLLKPTVTVIPQ